MKLRTLHEPTVGAVRIILCHEDKVESGYVLKKRHVAFLVPFHASFSKASSIPR